MNNISTSTCLWFNDQAEEAVALYTSLFPNSRTLKTTHYLEGGPMPAGSVLTVSFTLNGSEYVALNGGPHFSFSPAMSLVAYCETQDDVDRLWARLLEGGKESQCGWLTDKFGVPWQIIPRRLLELLNTEDGAASQRAWNAMLQMRKLDIAALQRAYDGG